MVDDFDVGWRQMLPQNVQLCLSSIFIYSSFYTYSFDTTPSDFVTPLNIPLSTQ